MSEHVSGLTRFGRMADQHWREYRPRLYRHLRRKKMLQHALLNAQEAAKSMIGELVSQQACDMEGAREIALHQFILLPSEDEEPLLSPDQMPFEQPEPTIKLPRKTR